MSQSDGLIVSSADNIVTLDGDVTIDKILYLAYQNINTKLIKVKVISQKTPETLVLEQTVSADK